jgi:hypothetical protein
MSQNLNIINTVGTVADPTQTTNPDGSSPPLLAGRGGETLVAEVHGQYYTAAYRGKTFFGSVTGVTIPAVASNLVSVCSLYNPPGSTVNLELLWVTIGFTSATTVLDNIGIYWQAGSTLVVPTSITQGTVNNGKLGLGKGQGQFLSAGTMTGTPALFDYIVSMLTTSTVPPGQAYKTRYQGELLMPPGSCISIAGSTAAWTASSANIAIGWAEWPV